MLAHAEALDQFRRDAEQSLPSCPRLVFLVGDLSVPSAAASGADAIGIDPVCRLRALLSRRFVEAIDTFLSAQAAGGPSDGLASALAQAYHQLGFQTLADQVRRSVRTVRGNQWMFRLGHPADHPLRIRPELLAADPGRGAMPLLRETTAVRMDFSHSAWSDIFFLGHGLSRGCAGARTFRSIWEFADATSDPNHRSKPILRVIDQPVIRLASVDLGATAEIDTIAEMFDFARDYLGLLKAAVIAVGLVPPGLEGCRQSIGELLNRIVGPGAGLELVSKINDIPKGSRLAVSTNLLGSLISILMRATGQVAVVDRTA